VGGGDPDNLADYTLRLPIYPTDQVSAGGKRIWTTPVEAEPFWYLIWMLGGENAQNVEKVLDQSILVHFDPQEPDEGLPPDYFDPDDKHNVRVVNRDGTYGSTTAEITLTP
jgi:hypothetical protein